MSSYGTEFVDIDELKGEIILNLGFRTDQIQIGFCRSDPDSTRTRSEPEKNYFAI